MASTLQDEDDTPPTNEAARAGAGPRTHIRRHPERAVPERTDEILRAGRVAHVGFVVDGQPFVIPLMYLYEDGAVYLHGAPASRTLQQLRSGTPVCIEVTLMDGLVASRDAKSHSMNYRSAIVFGTATPITSIEEKRAMFERLIQRNFPGRTAGTDYLPAREGDLRAVEVVAVKLEDYNAKTRSGPPLGTHDADEDGPGSRFVVPLPGIDA